MRADVRRQRTPQAQAADRFLLYERAVQDPARDVALFAHHFRRGSGRRARVLREDFCGGAAIARAWVQRHRDNVALAVDRDPTTLAWARARADRTLSPRQRARLRFLQADVRDAGRPRA